MKKCHTEHFTPKFTHPLTVVAEGAQPLEQVQGLRVVGDEHNFVVGLSLDVGQQAVQHRQLAGESGLQTPFRVVILQRR